ncbi:MAG: PD-(D/E)XK nuclease family protein [Clostridiales bacterium]|nr:PD-(D/E)XK nuclease family protein [Clostridiales bacterium]
MGDFTIRKYPEKSWSISKMKVIEGCYREYYYTYYGSHNGWLMDSTIEQKIAWRLKKLTNIWLMFGDKLHIVISENLKENNRNIKAEELIEYMRVNLNNGIKESILKYRSGKWDEYPKGEMLQEYYYGGKLEDKTVADIKERINNCSENFVKCKTYKELIEDNTKLLEADEGKFDYIVIEGVKVFALIDTLYIDSKGNYIIVDWKTGKTSEYDKEQLLVYAIYVMERYNVPLEKIRGRIEYLNLGEREEYIFEHSEIDDIYNRIKNDLNVINNFLIDKENNIPKEKEVFRKCDDIKKCNKCKYKKLCFDLEGKI